MTFWSNAVIQAILAHATKWCEFEHGYVVMQKSVLIKLFRMVNFLALLLLVKD
jgi:hypothetical protein